MDQKEENRLKYARRYHGLQDHATRGNSDRHGSGQRSTINARDKAQRFIDQKEVSDFFNPQGLRADHLENNVEYIEIQRRVRRRMKEIVASSVEQWSKKTSLHELSEIFASAQRVPGHVNYVGYNRWKSSQFVIRPSELKRYSELLRQHPYTDLSGKVFPDRISASGAQILLSDLINLDKLFFRGITPLAMERAFVTKQVRAEIKGRGIGKPKEKKLPWTYQNRPRTSDAVDEDEDVNSGLSPDLINRLNKIPLTTQQVKLRDNSRKEKYFGRDR